MNHTYLLYLWISVVLVTQIMTNTLRIIYVRLVILLNKILKQIPPVRMGIAGVDPIRDSSILFTRRLQKYGVDVKGKVYKHLMHGYLEMDGYPFY
jgi:acetyl esterase/lipase